MKLQKYWDTPYRKKSERWNLQIRFFLHFSSLLSLCHQCLTPESGLQHIFHFLISYSIPSTWNFSCIPNVLSKPSNRQILWHCFLIIWILIVISFKNFFIAESITDVPHFPPFGPSTGLLPHPRPSLYCPHYCLCPWCHFFFCVFLSKLHFLFDLCFSI